jgi:hypothetical protein
MRSNCGTAINYSSRLIIPVISIVLIQLIAISGGVNVECVWSHSGLYPTTIGVSNSGNAKQREARIKKFEFIGRLMAQALIDARMVDY